MIRPLLAALLLAGPARADGAPGAFDYWILALSWSPTWCALEGDPGDDQCGRGMGWLVHGLWPQFEEGYPVDCASRFPGPSDRDVERMADIMGSAGLARHEWRRHGTCSGLSPRDYFRTVREAREAAPIPGVLEALIDGPVRVDALTVEMAFLREAERAGGVAAATGMDGITVTCREGRIAEVRLCLSRDLAPRACGADAARDCRLEDALMEAP